MNDLIYNHWCVYSFVFFECFVRFLKPWISRDENGNIKIIDLSKKTKGFKIIIERISSFLNNHASNSFSTYSIFSVNQIMSSKISEFIRYFDIDKNEILYSQSGFAVIEFKTGPPILIGPFKPVKLPKPDSNTKRVDKIHSEDQCICRIEEQIKGKEKMIKAIYIFTKNNPCSGRKHHDPCMIQLANFSEKMFNKYNIDIFITFQDIYGATGNTTKAVNVLKKLSCEKSYFNTLSKLKKTVSKEHCRSKFVCFKRNRDPKRLSKTIKGLIKTDISEFETMNKMIIKLIDSFKIKFPSVEMTLEELKKSGEEQADEIKQKMIKLENQNLSEENQNGKPKIENQTKISEIIYSRFYCNWCDLVDKVYEEFIYEKLSDYINAFAVRFAYEEIKAISPHFNLIRVNLSD